MIFLCSGVGKLELRAMMDFQIASLSPLSPAWRPPGSGPLYNHRVISILKPSSSPLGVIQDMYLNGTHKTHKGRGYS
jgi:hypothetical protein